MKKPVRPNNDEEVDCKGQKENARGKVGKEAIDEISDHVDQIQDQADSGQNDPRHHQSRFCLGRNQSQSKWKKKVFEATFLAPWMRREATTT